MTASIFLISLPGGRANVGEGLAVCALRESEEEIFLQRSDISLLGELTTLPIPVSRHLVHPFVGLAADNLLLRPDPREVQDILFMSVAKLLDPDTAKYGGVAIPGGRYYAPYFELENHRIWGATAMILSELRAVLRAIVD